MVLYASPFEVAFLNAFDMGDSSTLVKSCQRGPQSVRDPQPKARKIVQPQYTVKHVDGTAFLEVELPGVARETVKLDIREGTLKVSGERVARSFDVGDQEKADARKERAASVTKDAEMKLDTGNPGSDRVKVPEAQRVPEVLARTITYIAEFTLPSRPDVGNASAEYKDGLLRVRLPRKEPEMQTIKIAM